MNLRPNHPVGQALGRLAAQVRAVPADGADGAERAGHRRDAARPGRAARRPVRGAARAARRTARRYAADAVDTRRRRGAHRRRRAWPQHAAATPSACRCSCIPTPRSVLGELAATVYGHPSERADASSASPGRRARPPRPIWSEAGLRSAGADGRADRHRRRAHRRRRHAQRADHARGARAAGAAGGDGRTRRRHRGDGGVQPRADTGPRRRRALRGRRVHQPVARPPRLPPDDGRTTSTPRRGCSTRRRRCTHALRVVCVDDDAGRAMAASRRQPASRSARPGAPPTGAPRTSTRSQPAARRSSPPSTRPACTTGCGSRLPGPLQRRQLPCGAGASGRRRGVARAGRTGAARRARCPAGWSRSTAARTSWRWSTTRTSRARCGRCCETLRAQTERPARRGVRRRRQSRPGQARADGSRRRRAGRPGGGHRRQSPRRGSRRDPGGDPGRRDRKPARGARSSRSATGARPSTTRWPGRGPVTWC